MSEQHRAHTSDGSTTRTHREAHPPESCTERLSFGEILRGVAPPPPVPGPYSLEPPDVVRVADPLSPIALDRIEAPGRRARRMKLGTIVLAVVSGAVIAVLPTRPVEPAPSGALTDAQIMSELSPFGVIASSRSPDAHAEPSASDATSTTELGVVRLAPIEIRIPAQAEAWPRVEHRQPEPERQIAVSSAYTGAVSQDPAPRPFPRAGAPNSSPRRELAEAHGKPGDELVLRTARRTRTAPSLLPDAPARDDVLQALAAVRDDARACAPEHRGASVPVTVTFAPTGRVTTAVVTGTLAGTPEGSCVARTFRRARVAEFTHDRFVVAYPLRL